MPFDGPSRFGLENFDVLFWFTSSWESYEKYVCWAFFLYLALIFLENLLLPGIEPTMPLLGCAKKLFDCKVWTWD